MNRPIAIIGTSKGLFFLRGNASRSRWELLGPFLSGVEINHATYDNRSGAVYATANSPLFGSEIVWSKDLGGQWEHASRNPKFSQESGLTLERIWHVEPGLPQHPKVLYAGVAPAALFKSEDSGETWEEVVGLSNHPTRPRWQPGAGGLCLHTIIPDPQDDKRMHVAISAAGTFRTDDGGRSWRPLNMGVRAEFLPQRYPEFGQCVHKMVMSPEKSSVLFQQNHCGVYRSDDGGEKWEEITSGLPSEFGLPMAIHPRETSTIYVIPLQGPEFRCPPEGKLRVFRSRNGGHSWEPLTRGLPQKNAFMGVYSEGMAMDALEPAGVYFGTNTGKVYFSGDEGDTWRFIADNLPPVSSVSVALVE